MTTQQPNILLIMADQLAPHFIGAYGHPIVKTPNIDALAARGTRFDAAYCNSPLCAPSRFCMMAGQLITRIAAYDNASDFPASIPTFAHYLRSMDYRTCLSGKMHFVGPDQLHGFEERITTDVYPSDYAWTPNWELPGERIDKWYHNMDSVREAGVAAGTFQLDYDDEVAFFARRKILDFARDGNQPFCLVASFIHPHDPYVALQQWWDLYDPTEIDLPSYVLKHEQQDPFSQRLMAGIEASTVMLSEDQIRNARHAYYANISYVDHKIGQLLKMLKATDQLDNTIVIVTADHGDMLGERGLWYKMNMFEHSARVPLLIAGPDIARQTVTNACSLVDLLPTLVDIAAQGDREKPQLAQPIDGRSLLPVARGEPDSGDEAIGEYCAEMTANPVLMIRRGPYKYIHCDDDPAMLFDIVNDPHEKCNLATRSDYADMCAEFRADVSQRWNSKTLRANIIATQRQRRAVHAAMQVNGAISPWDYNPPRDASNEYVRNHMDWTKTAAKMRFPP